MAPERIEDAERPLHRAPERHPVLQLLGDRLGDQLGVQLGPLDLGDVDLHRLAGHAVQLLAERVDLRARLADHDAGAGGVDVDRDPLLVLADVDVGQARVRELAVDVLADLASSTRYPGKSLSLVNQFDFQVWMMPTPSPPGWTLWPISSWPPRRRSGSRRRPRRGHRPQPPARSGSRLGSRSLRLGARRRPSSAGSGLPPRQGLLRRLGGRGPRPSACGALRLDRAASPRPPPRRRRCPRRRPSSTRAVLALRARGAHGAPALISPGSAGLTVIVMWQVRLRIRLTRPRARARQRFSVGPSSAYAATTTRSSASWPKLFSALETADFSTLPASCATAARLELEHGLGIRWPAGRGCARAPAAPCARTSARTGPAPDQLPLFRGVHRHPVSDPSACSCGRCRDRGRCGWGELAQLVADHRLRHEDGHMLAPVVHGDRVPHELGEDRWSCATRSSASASASSRSSPRRASSAWR